MNDVADVDRGRVVRMGEVKDVDHDQIARTAKEKGCVGSQRDELVREMHSVVGT